MYVKNMPFNEFSSSPVTRNVCKVGQKMFLFQISAILKLVLLKVKKWGKKVLKNDLNYTKMHTFICGIFFFIIKGQTITIALTLNEYDKTCFC